MKRVIIKPYLVDMMRRNFPEYELRRTQGVFYVFRRKETDDLYGYIVFQREGAPYNQLVISECGVGYNKNWDGQPSELIGYENSLGAIMAGSQVYSDVGWVAYGDNEESIAKCMDELKFRIDRYVHPFCVEAKEQTLKNELQKNTNEVMDEALPNISQEELEEIKSLIINGMNPRSKVSLYDYKDYYVWHDLVNSKMKNKVDFNRYIMAYWRDYFKIYY